MHPSEHAHAPHRHHEGNESHLTVKDPVCNMDVIPASAAGSVEHDGRTFYFCSKHCVAKFQADPDRFTAKADAPGARVLPSITVIQPPGGSEQTRARPVPPGASPAKYTCPMHPEIVRDGPGSCPICGMALEPLTVSGDGDDDHELVDMSRRFWLSVILTVPLVLISMAEMAGVNLPSALTGRAVVWLQLLLAAPVVLWCGLPFFERGWMSLVSRQLNMFTLIALGTGTAFVFSTIAALVPGIFPESLRAIRN